MSEMHRSPNNLKLEELIGPLCRRPKMYVGSENFEAIATFIQGFAFASDIHSRQLKEFNEWLAKKLEFPRNCPWWIGLEKKYPDSADALMELPNLFEEFLNTRSSSP